MVEMRFCQLEVRLMREHSSPNTNEWIPTVKTSISIVKLSSIELTECWPLRASYVCVKASG
jgi:hypothetical protein